MRGAACVLRSSHAKNNGGLVTSLFFNMITPRCGAGTGNRTPISGLQGRRTPVVLSRQIARLRPLRVMKPQQQAGVPAGGRRGTVLIARLLRRFDAAIEQAAGGAAGDCTRRGR